MLFYKGDSQESSGVRSFVLDPVVQVLEPFFGQSEVLKDPVLHNNVTFFSHLYDTLIKHTTAIHVGKKKRS